jgi:hypothetical protein
MSLMLTLSPPVLTVGAKVIWPRDSLLPGGRGREQRAERGERRQREREEREKERGRGLNTPQWDSA